MVCVYGHTYMPFIQPEICYDRQVLNLEFFLSAHEIVSAIIGIAVYSKFKTMSVFNEKVVLKKLCW